MKEILYEAVIKLKPVTKKNGQVIRKHWSTGKLFIGQNDRYCEYENNAGWFLMGVPRIEVPVNVQMVFYMPTHRIVDLSNLQAACLDILVKYSIIRDDNCNIVVSHDGSCVKYDEYEPRTEIIITKAQSG